MEHGERSRDPREDERKRNAALARYDAHPGIAVVLLAVMAFLFIVVAYQFVSDRVDNGGSRSQSAQTRAPQPPKN
jgi:hypothetical protein